MIINHNMAAMNTHRALSTNNASTAKSLEKLSSGLRINRAGDDAAGLAISEKMRGQIRGLDQASRNAQDGISMIQTTEGSLSEVHSILQRMRELAVQGANDTNVTADRTAISNELTALQTEIGRLESDSQFNNKKLLDGSAGAAVTIQVGSNAGEKIDLDFTTAGINLATIKTVDIKCSTSAEAQASVTDISAKIESVSAGRSLLGAYQNRLEHTINNLSTTSENLQASESRIRDVDMAKEMMAFQKNNILQQAATAMLAQANQQPQGVLQLLR